MEINFRVSKERLLPDIIKLCTYVKIITLKLFEYIYYLYLTQILIMYLSTDSDFH